MKKIILVFLLVILPIKVKAIDFYTNYELVKEAALEFLEETELLKREEFILYNNYKEEIINEDYYELGKNPNNAPFIDKDDYVIINENYQENNLEGNEIYNLSKIYKNVLTKLRYIKIRMIDCPSAILKEINIYYEDILINYDFIDKEYDFNHVLSSNEELIIDLNKDYDVSKIKLELLFKDEKMNNIEYKLSVSQKGYNFTYPTMYLTNKLTRFKEEEKVITEFLQEADFIEVLDDISWIKDKDITNFNYYKLEKILYKYFNLNKVYLNQYTDVPLDNYKHDLLDKRIVYNYYQREKITLEDNITDLNTIIKNTTIKNYDHIKTDIIYEDLYNGIIKITYKDNIFYHKFNLPDWSLNEEDRFEDINKNNDVINEDINTGDIIDKKEVLAFKEQVINNETNKNMTTIKPNISINYEDNNEVIDKKKSINNNYIFLIIFILLAIILLIFDKYIHKKKN